MVLTCLEFLFRSYRLLRCSLFWLYPFKLLGEAFRNGSIQIRRLNSSKFHPWLLDILRLLISTSKCYCEILLISWSEVPFTKRNVCNCKTRHYGLTITKVPTYYTTRFVILLTHHVAFQVKRWEADWFKEDDMVMAIWRG